MPMPMLDWEGMADARGFGDDDKKMLETLYKTMTVEELGLELLCNPRSITNRMKFHGLKTRTAVENHEFRKRTGRKSAPRASKWG